MEGQSHPLPYYVTVISDGHHRHLGDFRNYETAKTTARLALTHPTNTVATVRAQRSRAMLFAVDQIQEWERIEEVVPID